MRQVILAEMQRQHMSQLDLSKATGIPAPRLSEWLSGKRPRGATEQTINLVLEALKMQVTPTRKK